MAEKVNKGQVVHVRVSAPNVSRRELLSLAIDLIRIQKKHRDYLAKKKEKDALFRSLKKNVSEIREFLKTLDSYELPMSLNEIENLPQVKKHKEALQKMEQLRALSEKRIQEMEDEMHGLGRMQARPVPKQAMEMERRRSEPPKPSRPQREERKPEPKKPVDPLEADLEELQRKLETI